jgi:transposase-like protein
LARDWSVSKAIGAAAERGMKRSAKRRHAIGAAQRGQIVQRVIVDGWTIARTAAQFEVPPRLVKIWVADYRRYGMSSLRRAPRRTVAAEIVTLLLLRPLASLLRCLSYGRPRFFAGRRHPEVPPVLGSMDDRRGGSS